MKNDDVDELVAAVAFLLLTSFTLAFYFLSFIYLFGEREANPDRLIVLGLIVIIWRLGRISRKSQS